MINPIIPLAISMSEGRRTFAYFLGSGVSADAGVPTGGAIFWHAVQDLYTMIHSKPSESDGELDGWFRASEYSTLNYSSILEHLRPAPEDRRLYLEELFVGKQPTAAHRAIAGQVKEGFVSVIVTTNFDRLMEKALDDLGVSFDVVAAPEDLKQVRPREHSPCRILKLHGDYQRCNIRNTERELEQLDGSIATEFQEILDRYGFIVIGYSGGDKDFRHHLQARQSRYGLYWVAKGRVSDWVKEAIRQQDGRLIDCESADSFLSELAAKIGVFRAAPEGETPEFIIRQAEERLRTGDLIGLRHDIDRASQVLRKVLYDANMDYWPITHGQRPILDELVVAMQPLCAVGYVLIRHRRWEEFDHCLTAVQIVLDVSKLRPQQYSSMVAALPLLVTYDLVMLWAMYSLMVGAYHSLRRLMLRSWRTSNSLSIRTNRLWENPWDFQQPPILGNDQGEAFRRVLKVARDFQFIWGELIATDDDLAEMAFTADLVLAFLNAAKYKQPGAWWPNFGAMHEWRQRDLIRRFHRDPEFLQGVAAVFDESPEEFASHWDERMAVCAKRANYRYNVETFLLWMTGEEP